MSLSYVTLAEVKSHLYIMPSEIHEDAYLTLLIQAASAHIKNYLGNFSAYEGQRDDDDDYYLDSNYEPEIALSSDGRTLKPEVKAAVLLMIGEWYKNREGDGANYEHLVLPAPVMALLISLRDPVCR